MPSASRAWRISLWELPGTAPRDRQNQRYPQVSQWQAQYGYVLYLPHSFTYLLMLLLSQPFIALTGFQPGTSTAKGKSVEPVGQPPVARPSATLMMYGLRRDRDSKHTSLPLFAAGIVSSPGTQAHAPRGERPQALPGRSLPLFAAGIAPEPEDLSPISQGILAGRDRTINLEAVAEKTEVCDNLNCSASL